MKIHDISSLQLQPINTIQYCNFMQHKFTLIMVVKHEIDQIVIIDIAKCCVKSARFVMLNLVGPAGCTKIVPTDFYKGFRAF